MVHDETVASVHQVQQKLQHQVIKKKHLVKQKHPVQQKLQYQEIITKAPGKAKAVILGIYVFNPVYQEHLV